jgi:hypothetical protein
VNRWILGAIVGAIGAILAVGCGGGDDSTTTTISKAEFTKQASAICAEGEQKMKAALADYSKTIESTPGGTSDRDIQRNLANEMVKDSIIPTIQEELEQLEELGVPTGDGADVSKMVKTLSKSVKSFEDNGVRELVNPEEFVRFQEEAKAYGLDCESKA